MAPKDKHDPFERTVTARIASGADIAAHAKASFLRAAKFRTANDAFSFKGWGIAAGILLGAQAIAPIQDATAPDIPDPREQIETRLTQNDIDIAGSHNDLITYGYAETNGASIYTLTLENGRYALYAAPESAPVAPTLIEDSAQARRIIETHILPNMQAGPLVTESGVSYEGHDYLESCAFISLPIENEAEQIIRHTTCKPYAETTPDWVENKVAQNRSFWQDALTSIQDDNYGFTAQERAEIPSLADIPSLEENTSSNFEDGLKYGGLGLAGWFAFASLGALGASARRRRDAYYAEKGKGPTPR